MPRYFMSDTKLGWLEKMMMDPSRTPHARTAPRQKRPQKEPPYDRPTKPRPHEWEIREGSV